MIREFSIKAKPTNGKARKLTATLFILCAILTVVYLAIPTYKGIVGFFILVLITAAVFLYNKYIASVYYYDLTFDHTGECVFVVRQTVGKKVSTLARLSLSDVTDVSVIDSAAYKKLRTPLGYRKYVYLPTVSPATVCVMTVISPYESATVAIELSQEMANLLKEYTELQKKDYKAEDF